MRPVNLSIVILSAEIDHLSLFDNFNRTIELKDSLKSLGMVYKTVDGYYKGAKETSFMVVIRDISDIATLQSIAAHFDQECILFSDSDRDSKLLYSNGNEVSIGKLKPVSKNYATSQDNYTYCSDLNQYYICE